MKKLIIFIIILIMVSLKAHSGCPPGFQSSTIVNAVDPNGCHWNIEICYKCVPQGPDPSNAQLLNIYPAPGYEGQNCTYADPEWIRNRIAQRVFEECLIQHCGSGCSDFITDIPMCWYWHRYTYKDNQGDKHYNKWLQPCDFEAYCRKTSKICFNSYEVVDCIPPSVTYTQFGSCQYPFIPENEVPNLELPDGETIVQDIYWPAGRTTPCFEFITCP